MSACRFAPLAFTGAHRLDPSFLTSTRPSVWHAASSLAQHGWSVCYSCSRCRATLLRLTKSCSHARCCQRCSSPCWWAQGATLGIKARCFLFEACTRGRSTTPIGERVLVAVLEGMWRSDVRCACAAVEGCSCEKGALAPSWQSYCLDLGSYECAHPHHKHCHQCGAPCDEPEGHLARC